MSTYLPREVHQQLEAADDHRCAYCRTSAATTGQPMTVDHITPTSQGGSSAYNNLCFACRRCNEFKASQTTAVDPLRGEYVALFHPRHDTWSDHFEWDETGTVVIGLTSTGRATILALQMNNPLIVAARRRWVNVGWHPPGETRKRP
jgi:hypothetical protein